MTELTQRILESNLPTVFTGDDVKRLVPDAGKRRRLMKHSVDSGELVKSWGNCYTLDKEYRKDWLNDFLLSNLMIPNSYVSLETALSMDSWIPEAVFVDTCVTSEKSCEIETFFRDFIYVHIPQKNLLAGVETVTFNNGETHLQAKPLKALADMVYERNFNWKNLEPLVESLRIEPDDLETLTGADFDELQGNYGAANVENFLSGIRKELAV
jgi:hypothetical protein